MRNIAKKGERFVKKEYKKPLAEIIEFVSEERIMNDDVIDPDDDIIGGDSGSVEEW